jgi:hypothetical protein
MKTAWLIFYNLASAAGWAWVLFLAGTSLAAGKSPAEAWKIFGPTLMLVQSTMAMEILHAITGMASACTASCKSRFSTPCAN